MNDQELGEARQRARMRNLENVPGTNERNSDYSKPSTPAYTPPNYGSTNSSSRQTSRSSGRRNTKSTTQAGSTNKSQSGRTLITIACVAAAAYYATIWQQDEQNLIITGIAALVAGFIGYKLYRFIWLAIFCVAGYYIYQWWNA